jgi:hypothetical protein
MPWSKLDLLERLSEIPYRLRARPVLTPTTWPLREDDRRRIVVNWPTTYEWPGAAPIVSAIKAGLEGIGVIRLAPVPQPYKSVVMLECLVDGRSFNVALDYYDKADFISESALAQSHLYFKCQYASAGYSDNRIIPGGYPVTFAVFYKYLDVLRTNVGATKSIDIVGRFGYSFQRELRSRAVALLSDQEGLNYRGAGGKVRYSSFLREIATSRLALHLPGNGPFTHRVAEFLGLGTCMLSLRFPVELQVPLEPGVHYVEIADDLGDLVEKTRYYLDHHEERERIAVAGRDFFDQYLHCDQLAGYHLRCILDSVDSAVRRTV